MEKILKFRRQTETLVKSGLQNIAENVKAARKRINNTINSRGPFTRYHPSGKQEDKSSTPLRVSPISLKWAVPVRSSDQLVTKYCVEVMDDRGKWQKEVECPGTQTTASLNNLILGRIYQLRVRDATEKSQGEPEEPSCREDTGTDEYERFSGKPGKPRDLEITFSSENDVFLKWKSPELDDGIPITNYFIEALDNLGNWRIVKEIPSNQEITSIKDLEPERVYRFRVTAVNDAGAGEPSNVTPFTVPKRKGYPPKIHHGLQQKVQMKVGQPFGFQRIVEADPSAFVSWTLDGRPIKTGSRVKLAYENCSARFEILRCKKEDSGMYSITAVNKYGRMDRDMFQLVVKGGVVKGILKKIGKATFYTVGTNVAIFSGIAAAVHAMGFTESGIAADSLAAAYQSLFLLGNKIPPESVFATFQSIGKNGIASSTVASTFGAFEAFYLYQVFTRKKPKE